MEELEEFINELKHNQEVNFKKRLVNRVDIDYIIERLEDITNNLDKEDDFIKNEVEYWLNNLIFENSNDEIGIEANEILEDEQKIERIVSKIENDADIWDVFHRSIEWYMFH